MQREVEDLKRSLAQVCGELQTKTARLRGMDSGTSGGRTTGRITLKTGVGNTVSEDITNYDGLPASLAESENDFTDRTSKTISGEIRMKFETQGDISIFFLFFKNMKS